MPKKPEGGSFETFQHSFCRRRSKNWRRDPLGKFFRKSLTMPKKSGRDDFPLESPDTVCYAEKHKKSIWFSVQFAEPTVSIWHHKIS